jgi:hypothetical protein
VTDSKAHRPTDIPIAMAQSIRAAAISRQLIEWIDTPMVELLERVTQRIFAASLVLRPSVDGYVDGRQATAELEAALAELDSLSTSWAMLSHRRRLGLRAAEKRSLGGGGRSDEALTTVLVHLAIAAAALEELTDGSYPVGVSWMAADDADHSVRRAVVALGEAVASRPDPTTTGFPRR